MDFEQERLEVLRWASHGVSHEEIGRRLTARGLDEATAQRLLREIPVALPAVSTLGVGILGLAISGAAGAGPTRRGPAPTQKLSSEDPSPRCSLHPDFASVGTCPRCGAFACTACAPEQGFASSLFCAACDASASVREQKAMPTSRGVGVVILAITAWLGWRAYGAFASGDPQAVSHAVAPAVLIALGVAQTQRASLLPGGLAALAMLLLAAFSPLLNVQMPPSWGYATLLVLGALVVAWLRR